MSSREPLWFCHQCHAEMRPLMVPDPVCASCRGAFVEKMENPSDDPREFQQPGAADVGAENLPPGIDTFLFSLQGLMDRGMTEGNSITRRRASESGPNPRVTFQVHSSAGGPRTITIGGPNIHGRRPVPSMSEFLQRGPDAPEGGISGPVMAQYLMALLGQRDPFAQVFARGMGDNPGVNGRMGDYVFNQEALDQIITQLMENSNSGRPVPATEQIIENLPREVLEIGSPTLEQDCAVCKDQFKLETDDPDEQVVVTLPCKHPFHETCILPWLKSSGTCPVCRHALIPQPEHPVGPGPGPGGPHDRPGSPSSRRTARPPFPDQSGAHDSSGLFQSLFGYMGAGSGGSNGGGGSGGAPHQTGSNSGHAWRPSDQRRDPRNNVPGSWNEDFD